MAVSRDDDCRPLFVRSGALTSSNPHIVVLVAPTPAWKLLRIRLELRRHDRNEETMRLSPIVDRGQLAATTTQGPISEFAMLGWALTFLVVSLIAAALGFGLAAGTAAWVAKVLFVVFIVLFLVSLVSGRRTPVA